MGKKTALTMERRNKLAQLLVSEGSAKVGDLAGLFGVSTETIRKDLLWLEREGYVKKSHGGAMAAGQLLERPLAARAAENVEAKGKIALAALALLPGKGTLVLDAGSTTHAIAKQLALRSGFTVFTNSAAILATLSGSRNTVYALGGEMRGSSMALVGMWALRALAEVRADLAFLGTDGFCGRGGPCTASYAEADVKRAMITGSTRAVLVCDSRKFRTDAMVQFCEWGQVDCLVTDDGADRQDIRRVEQLTKIIVAGGAPNGVPAAHDAR